MSDSIQVENEIGKKEIVENEIGKNEIVEKEIEKNEIVEKEPEKNETEKKVTEKNGNRKRFPFFWCIVAGLVLLLVILNLLARIPVVCDFYVNHIFGLWSETVSRLTGLFPFSVGEMMIYLTVSVLLLLILLSIVYIWAHRKKAFRRFYQSYLKGLVSWVLLVAFLITLNLSPLYKSSHFKISSDYTVEEITALRNYVVAQCNSLAPKMERDDLGYVIPPEGADSSTVKTWVEEAMHAQATEFPRLQGYYPSVKELLCSNIMYDISTIGVYFPFSMEANISAEVDMAWRPHTMAHELSHLKGYIYEDEAEYIAFMSCVNSEKEYLRYSTFLNILLYVENDFYASVGKKAYCEAPAIDQQVVYDACCYTYETIERNEARQKNNQALTETVENMSTAMTDAYLDYYESKANYSEMTALLLEYYRTHPMES